ncbi:hypothetical protein C8F01DRAFT_1375261 [Mycena amicta]|nr:hypothetical protein C8F01DRAFT_1375261 [Mycena amicta]
MPLDVTFDPRQQQRTLSGPSNVPSFAPSARRLAQPPASGMGSLPMRTVASRARCFPPPKPLHRGTSLTADIETVHTLPPCAPRLRTVPLPSQIPGITSVVLHPALIANECDPRFKLTIDFDDIPDRRELTPWPELRSAQATLPALPSLTITSADIPWAITAHASGEFIPHLSVVDVLLAISHALQMGIEVEDWARYANASAKHKSRSDRNRTQYRNANLRRIDLLDGRTKFAGLAASDSESETGCDMWILKTV